MLLGGDDVLVGGHERLREGGDRVVEPAVERLDVLEQVLGARRAANTRASRSWRNRFTSSTHEASGISAVA